MNIFQKAKNWVRNINWEEVAYKVTIGLTVALMALIVGVYIKVLVESAQEDGRYMVTFQDTRDGSLHSYIVTGQQLEEIQEIEKRKVEELAAAEEAAKVEVPTEM